MKPPVQAYGGGGARRANGSAARGDDVGGEGDEDDDGGVLRASGYRAATRRMRSRLGSYMPTGGPSVRLASRTVRVVVVRPMGMRHVVVRKVAVRPVAVWTCEAEQRADELLAASNSFNSFHE